MPGGEKDVGKAESWLTERFQTQVRKRTASVSQGLESSRDRAGTEGLRGLGAQLNREQVIQQRKQKR